MWEAVAQWSELKQKALGSIPGGYPGFVLFQLVYSNVDRMKDLWCSSTVRLLSTQTRMNVMATIHVRLSLNFHVCHSFALKLDGTEWPED